MLPVLPCGHAPPFRPRHRLGSRQPTRDRSGRAAGAWTEKDGEFPALFKPLLFGSLSPQLNEAPEECAARAEAGDFRPRRTAGRAGARPAEAWPWSHPEPSAPSLPSALVLVTQELRMMTSDINGARAVAQASTPGSRQGPHGLGDSPRGGLAPDILPQSQPWHAARQAPDKRGVWASLLPGILERITGDPTQPE